ncbi:MAG: hypothetical protein V4700_03470 [Pseudomonadota bacterium]
MSKVTITLSDGKSFEHDFCCNNPYAEMFQIIREIIGIDSRVKWFKELKDEFYNIQCFGDTKVDISKDS